MLVCGLVVVGSGGKAREARLCDAPAALGDTSKGRLAREGQSAALASPEGALQGRLQGESQGELQVKV